MTVISESESEGETTETEDSDFGISKKRKSRAPKRRRMADADSALGEVRFSTRAPRKNYNENAYDDELGISSDDDSHKKGRTKQVVVDHFEPEDGTLCWCAVRFYICTAAHITPL